MYDDIHSLLNTLQLHGISNCLNQVLSTAEREGKAMQDILLQLLTAEYQYKSERSLAYRIKQAKLPWPWTLDSFPFQLQPAVSKSQIMSLAKLDFIQNCANVTFIGNPGTGKTGLAISLLRQALINGYRGRFYTAQDLLSDLYASLADRATSSLLKSIAAYDILVIDELGYLTLTTEQINIFFKLIDMRYHKKATIITTNLDYHQWYDVFQNKALVDALIDRFKHYCTTIYINGPGLRAPVENQNHK